MRFKTFFFMKDAFIGSVAFKRALFTYLKSAALDARDFSSSVRR